MAILKIDSTQLTKERLSIEIIGRRKFYIGLLVGLLWTILLYLFFAYFREVLRRQTFDHDLIIPTRIELFVYDLFFAAVSVTIGFALTVWFWFHGLFSKQTPRRRINYISAYAIFWGMTLLYLVSKTGTNMTWILFATIGYDDHLNLASEFPLLLALLPTVFYLNIWTHIRLSYRSGNWLLKSFVVFIVLSTILAFSSPIDQSILNESWNRYMAPYNEIVDNEIKRANLNGIEVSEKAIETIKFNKKERALKQITKLKERFKDERPIPTDSVVLELILVKKTTVRFADGMNWENKTDLWPFALPRDIYRQMKISNDSIKNNYLKEILSEYESIFNEDWDNIESIREDGLYDKYFYRSSMKRWYKEIELELDGFKDK